LSVRTLILAGCCLTLACCSATMSGDTPSALADMSTITTVMVMDAKVTATLDSRQAQALSVASPDGLGCVVAILASDVRPDNGRAWGRSSTTSSRIAKGGGTGQAL
jgi:hypothetical protein